MKKSNAFTLAEVLICLAIVSIVAAIVLPALVNNTRGKTDGASLARAVELVQNGTAQILNQAQSRNTDGNAFANLSAIQVKDIFENAPEGLSEDDYIANEEHLFADTRTFTNLNPVENYNTNNIKTYTGEALQAGLLENTHTYKFAKNDPIIIAQNIDSAVAEAAGNDDIIARVLIDANGSAKPNQLGRDIFLFGLSNNGTLIPAGSKAYNDFDNSVEVDACAEEPGDGLACAARIMADGWVIKY